MFRYVTKTRHDLLTIALVMCICALFAFVISCGKDDGVGPTSIPPVDEGDDLPPVPTLSGPNDDPPMRSELVYKTRKAIDYAPRVSTALVDWWIRGYGIYEEWPTWIDCSGGWRNLCGTQAAPDHLWNNEIPSATGCFGACGLVSNYCPDSWVVKFDEWPDDARITFITDGVTDTSPDAIKWLRNSSSICKASLPLIGCSSKVIIRSEYNVKGGPLDDTPFLRRERFWVAKPFNNNVYVHRITGDNEVTEEWQYMTGSEETHTESFAWTVGASIGATFKGLSAQIEGSVTKTFEESVTVSESATTTTTRLLKGDAGKVTCHILWTLVERYRFVHKNGDAFTDPNYVLHPGYYDATADTYFDFEIQGKMEHLAKYVFDDTGRLLEVSIVE